MSETSSGAKRQYRTGAKVPVDASRPLRADGTARPLTEVEQLEFRLKKAEDENGTLLDRLARQQYEFDHMMRRSEKMRNNQVDIINRLLKGGTISDELTMALREIADLQVRLADLQLKHDYMKKSIEEGKLG